MVVVLNFKCAFSLKSAASSAIVDQLMTPCDELEAKLARSQKDGAGLMDAVVGEMVAG